MKTKLFKTFLLFLCFSFAFTSLIYSEPELYLPDPVFVDDDEPPLTKITHPSENHITNKSLDIVGETQDNFLVEKVILSYTNYYDYECMEDFFEITELFNEKGKYVFNWKYENWEPKEDGIYCLIARGVDDSGNIEKTSVVENVIYDTKSPNIVFFEIVEGILKVEAEDELSGLKSIEFKINDGEFKKYSEDLNVENLVDNIPGKYTVFVKVKDMAGNENVQEKEFEIEEIEEEILGVQEEEKEELPETGQAIVAIFVTAAILLPFSLFFKKLIILLKRF